MTHSTADTSHLARMSFYDEGDTLLSVVEGMQVPRVGDVVGPPGSTQCWTVRAVQWTCWPDPRSVDGLRGITGPMVDLICSPSRGVHL